MAQNRKEYLREYGKIWFQKNKERIYPKRNEQRLWKHYGLTVEDFNNLLLRQEGNCAICLQALREKAMHIDHCHRTNTVRGLLCRSCNLGLGMFKDSFETLSRAVDYLLEFRASQP